MIEPLRPLPIARKVAIPVDAAGEAGLREGIDEYFLLVRRQDRRARIVFRIVARNHLREGQIGLRRGTDTRDRRLGRLRLWPRQRLAHERVKRLLDAAAKDPVWLACGVL